MRNQELRQAAQEVVDSYERGRPVVDGVNKLIDALDQERAQELADASSVVVDAMLELYRLNDGDEAAVGEALYEINKAARRTYHEVTSR